MSEPHDPTRALDGHERPPSWEDIVARAERPAQATLVDIDRRAGWRGRSLLAIAAVVVAVAAVGTAVVSTTRGNDDQPLETRDQPERLDPPTSILGHVWQITRIVMDNDETLVVPAGEHPARVAITKGGKVTINQGCGQIDGAGHVDGDRFEADGLWARSQTCTPMYSDPDVEARMRLIERREADWLQRFLEGRPKIEARGMGLVLKNDEGDGIEFLDFTVFANPETMTEHEWRITRFVIDGEDLPVEQDQLGQPPSLRFVGDELRYSVRCNSGGGPAAVDGEVLYSTGRWVTTLVKCENDISAAVQGFVRTLPVVQIHGKQLVLSRGQNRLEAEMIEATTTTTTTGPDVESTTTAVPTTTTPATTTVVTTTTEPDPMDDIPAFEHGDWIVRSALQDGESTGYEGATFTTRYVGPPNGPEIITVRVSGCNGAGGRMRFTAGRLTMIEPFDQTAMACVAEPGGVDLSAQDTWFSELLAAGPTVAYDLIDDNTATITGPDGQLVIVDRV